MRYFVVLVGLLLVGCFSIPPSMVNVTFKPTLTTAVECVVTPGAIILVQDPIDAFPIVRVHLTTSDTTVFTASKDATLIEKRPCNPKLSYKFWEHHQATMYTEEFNFKYDHDKAFHDSIASYTFQ